MSYTEKEFQQVLARLAALLTLKITNSITPDVNDLEFLNQLRAFVTTFSSNNNTNTLNNHSKTQTQLRTFLKKGNPWEKLKTPIENVSVIKVPLKKQESAILHLVIEFVKREIDIKNSEIFHKLQEVIEDSRVNILIKEIDKVNAMKIRIPT